MIKATGHIIHDGSDYVEGDILHGTQEQEQALIDFGVAEPIEGVEEPVAEPVETQVEETPAEKAIEDMNRAELEAKATEAGVESPEEVANKSLLVDAIKNAQAPVEEPASEEAPVEEPVAEPVE